MKNKTLSLFLPLSVSLSRIWRNLKNSKRKSRKKEGKEKRNPEHPEFYISQRTLFQKKNCTLSTVCASHISTPILYANPNPNLTRPNTENRLTTSRAITNAWNIFIPEQLPSPFSARQMVGLSFRVYTRTCVDLKNSKFAREEKKRIHRLFGKQVEEGRERDNTV